MSGGDGDGGDGDTTGEKEYKPRTMPAPESSGMRSKVAKYAVGGEEEDGERVAGEMGSGKGGDEREGDGERDREVGGRLK